jgi:hypothetical protein
LLPRFIFDEGKRVSMQTNEFRTASSGNQKNDTDKYILSQFTLTKITSPGSCLPLVSQLNSSETIATPASSSAAAVRADVVVPVLHIWRILVHDSPCIISLAREVTIFHSISACSTIFVDFTNFQRYKWNLKRPQLTECGH